MSGMSIASSYDKACDFSLGLFTVIALGPNLAYARRGCCSWHGGVAGCDRNVGRLVYEIERLEREAAELAEEIENLTGEAVI